MNQKKVSDSYPRRRPKPTTTNNIEEDILFVALGSMKDRGRIVTIKSSQVKSSQVKLMVLGKVALSAIGWY